MINGKKYKNQRMTVLPQELGSQGVPCSNNACLNVTIMKIKCQHIWASPMFRVSPEKTLSVSDNYFFYLMAPFGITS